MRDVPALMSEMRRVTDSALGVLDRVSGEHVWLVDHWTLQRGNKDFEDIRPSPERARDLADRAKMAADWLLSQIGGDLRVPEIEGWDPRSIELALGYFVRTFADALTLRKEIFDSAIRGLEDPELVTPVPVENWAVPRTSKDFLKLCRSSLDFNRQLFSLIAIQEQVARNGDVLDSMIRSEDDSTSEATGAADSQTGQGDPMSRLLSCREIESCEHIHCASNLFARWHLVVLSALTLGKTRVEGDLAFEPRTGGPDMEARTRAFGVSQGGGAHEKLWRAMEWLLPVSLFEGLGEAVTVGHRAPAPKRWVGPVPSLDHDHVQLAVHARRGTEIYFTQHGGYYGESVIKPSEFHERSASNGFVTWGWSDGHDCVPLPAPRLRHRRDRFRISRILRPLARAPSDPGSILWVTQDALPWDLQLPARSVGVYTYIESCRLFRAGLSPAGERRILVRYRPDKFRLGDADLRQPHGSVFEGLAIADPEALVHDLLESASLVILDQAFTTTFLECLSMDIPVVVFDPVSFAYTRPERRPIYEALLAAEVVHTDPARAAAQIEVIMEDVPGWWMEPARRRAVAEARDELAQVGPKYFSRWRAFLAGGLDESSRREGYV